MIAILFVATISLTGVVYPLETNDIDQLIKEAQEEEKQAEITAKRKESGSQAGDPRFPTDLSAAVDLTCHELNLTAKFDENVLVGDIKSITMTGCADTDFIVVKHTVSTSFNKCAKEISEDTTQITQEDEVVIVSGNTGTVIQRLAKYTFKLQCKFDRRLNVSIGTAINVKDKTETFTEDKVTDFVATMTIYESERFATIASNPVRVTTFQKIYMQVVGVHNNKHYKFIAQDCYATSTGNPNDNLRYLFFSDKCPVDKTFKEINPGTENTFSFEIEAFQFIKVKEKVYFHCSLFICKKGATSEECTQQCKVPGSLDVSLTEKREVEEDQKPLEQMDVRSSAIVWDNSKDQTASMYFEDQRRPSNPLLELADEIRRIVG